MYHPDRCFQMDEAERARANEIFKKYKLVSLRAPWLCVCGGTDDTVSQAYDELKEDVSRVTYDLEHPDPDIEVCDPPCGCLEPLPAVCRLMVFTLRYFAYAGLPTGFRMVRCHNGASLGPEKGEIRFKTAKLRL